MSRYVFLNSEAQDVKVLAAVQKAARSRGATVVKSLAGTMLGPGARNRGGGALPGWRYSVERKTTTVPERKSLERTKARGAPSAVANG